MPEILTPDDFVVHHYIAIYRNREEWLDATRKEIERTAADAPDLLYVCEDWKPGLDPIGALLQIERFGDESSRKIADAALFALGHDVRYT